MQTSVEYVQTCKTSPVTSFLHKTHCVQILLSVAKDFVDSSKRFYDNRNSEKFNQKRAFGLFPSVLDESESRRAFGTHDTHVIQPCDSLDTAISVFKSAVTSFPLFDLKVCEGSSFQGIGFFDFRAPQKTHSRENVFVTFGNLAIDWESRLMELSSIVESRTVLILD